MTRRLAVALSLIAVLVVAIIAVGLSIGFRSNVLFLIMTIVQCNMSGVAIWKSSTLPILQGRVKDLHESYEQRRR